MPKRIKAIGIELEGGWAAGRAARGHVKHDGSVVLEGADGHQVGEMCSEPIDSLEKAEAWVRDNYPNRVNDTCGLHVHVSLAPLHYSRLMNEDFNNCFLNAMEDFYTRFRSQPTFELFRRRLDGQNQYCQKVFRPEQQLWRQETYGDRRQHPRYSQLNYCFSRHGTMECRLFPCFERVEHSVEAVKVFVNCVEDYLATLPPEKTFTVRITKSPTTELAGVNS